MSFDILYMDIFQQISFDSECRVAVLKWLDGTSEINYPQFKGSMLKFSGFALQNKARAVLIDSRAFAGQKAFPSMEEMYAWRSREVSPVYNEAGVEKFAFLFGTGFPIPPSNGEKGENENYPTRYFTDEGMAFDYLRR